MIDSLFLFAQKKYVDSRVSSSPTKGGPQPRLSSPVGLSTLIGSPWFRVSGDVVLAGHAASRAVA